MVVTLGASGMVRTCWSQVSRLEHVRARPPCLVALVTAERRIVVGLPPKELIVEGVQPNVTMVCVVTSRSHAHGRAIVALRRARRRMAPMT